ncbi:DUF402 domain-containing protein [Actinoplanes sp. RD1]|uniref:DUF402 domain-containing protein n=1 Tax=Actinoplanes sp. RD1 TaxID=3064538 RepID=UPI002741DF75|nr:DUF402 domain-containing protein [Actinoplanes sp. RD1]
MTSDAPFAPGTPIVRRFLHPDGRIAAASAAYVIADDERGLLLWSDIGSAVMRRTTLSGTPTRDLPISEELGMTTMLSPTVREHVKSLLFLPRDAAHAVSWSWRADGAFAGWYVNLETPAQRWPGGVDSSDQVLDLLVTPDREWHWKDEEDLVAAYPRAQAALIRAEGERVTKLVDAAEFPFNGAWLDFTSELGPAPLPPTWDVPANRP